MTPAGVIPMPDEVWRVGLAAVPIVIVLVGLLGLNWSGVRSGAVALAAAAALGLTIFAVPAGGVAVALWRSLALSLHVLYIIWAALVLYKFADESGAIRSIGRAIGHLTGDRVLQLLIIGFAFSSFLQGVAGFGVPVAVTAPLLLGLGFTPLESAAIPLIGHAWSVTMGDMASSFQALRAVTGLPPHEMGNWIAVFLGLSAVASGFAVAHMHGGARSSGRAFGSILTMGLAMGLTHLVLSVTQHWTIASFGAGMVGLAVGIGLTRLGRRGDAGAVPTRAPLEQIAGSGTGEMPFQMAFLPYYVLIAVIASATFVPGLHQTLEHVAFSFRYPEITTGLGWKTGAGAFALPIFGHPGALLLYASGIAAVLFNLLGRPSPDWGAVWKGVSKQGLPTTLTILALVGTAMIMLYSGMTYLLARGLVLLVGSFFPLISPFIGLLGAVITGSNTNSNVLFGALQRDGAQMLAMNPALMAALQSSGGSLGSMIAPAKVVLATATTGLLGQEGRVMRATAPYAIAMAAAIGLLGWILLSR
ncbi:MAG: L-lactate permease [Armatimonadetes bacterium]|nr:L-lactate permease [Armatimonadota bacterium]